MSTHFLHDFLCPKSIAIYGANNTYGTTFGSFQLMNIIMSGYKGNIYPIHLKLETILGYKAYKSILDVPEVPDLVIIVLPPQVVPQIMRDCGEKGVKYIVLISAGFREVTGDRANNLTEEITEIANHYGIRFIGPNCFGFYNSWLDPEDNAKFNMMIWSDQRKRGKFSVASQSGTMSSHLWYEPDYIDLNLGKSISVGNEANIDLVDFLEYFKDDDETDVIGLYIEEVKRGKEFISLAKEITPKKPIIAVYGGGSKAGNRAIKSHTGSIAGNSKIFEAMIKETGIIHTDYVEEFLDIASILSNSKFPYPKGKRLGIITNSGGPGALIANNADRKGLIVPEFSDELQQKLKSMLPHTASWTNPLDVTFDMNIFNFYINFPKILMTSGEIDAIVMYGSIGFQDILPELMENDKISPYIEFREDMKERISEVDKLFIRPTIKLSQKHSIPIIYINPQSYNSQWSQKIRSHGGIVFKFWDRPVNCLAKICEYAEYRRNHSNSK
jgi:acyl-CoA synthetase (NDP forming)